MRQPQSAIGAQVASAQMPRSAVSLCVLPPRQFRMCQNRFARYAGLVRGQLICPPRPIAENHLPTMQPPPEA